MDKYVVYNSENDTWLVMSGAWRDNKLNRLVLSSVIVDNLIECHISMMTDPPEMTEQEGYVPGNTIQKIGSSNSIYDLFRDCLDHVILVPLVDVCDSDHHPQERFVLGLRFSKEPPYIIDGRNYDTLRNV